MWTPVILFAVGIAAIILEFFIPAFGLVGIAGAGSLAAAVVIAFRTLGTTAGSIFLILTIIFVPALVLLFFRLFPRTLFGRRLILHHSQTREEGYSAQTAATENAMSGMEGTALTDLRPSGTALLEEKRYSVVSRGEYIEKNEEIIVVSREGSRIVVKRRL